MKRHGDANRIFSRMNLCLGEKAKSCGCRVEDAVLTVEVKPITTKQPQLLKPSGQVVLKRLITAEQVIERLGAAETMCQLTKEMGYKPRP